MLTMVYRFASRNMTGTDRGPEKSLDNLLLACADSPNVRNNCRKIYKNLISSGAIVAI